MIPSSNSPSPPLPTLDPTAARSQPRPPAQEKQPFSLWGDDGFNFYDILDIINPLQHLPVVATLYRKISDDELAAAPRVLGGALFGGVIGFGAALLNAIVEQVSGRDVGEHVMVALLENLPSALPFGQDMQDELDELDIQETQFAQAATTPVAQSAFQEFRQDGFFNLELSERIGFPARAERHIRLLAARETYTQNQLLLAAVTSKRLDAEL